MTVIGHKQTSLLVHPIIFNVSTMSILESPSGSQEGLVIRPRSERRRRLAMIQQPKLVAKADEFFQSCDGEYASFNAFTETHLRFILKISRTQQSEKFGISFAPCLYLAGPTFWSNARLRCKSIEDSEGQILFEVADEAVGFVVRCGAIIVPTFNLTLAYG